MAVWEQLRTSYRVKRQDSKVVGEGGGNSKIKRGTRTKVQCKVSKNKKEEITHSVTLQSVFPQCLTPHYQTQGVHVMTNLLASADLARNFWGEKEIEVLL